MNAPGPSAPSLVDLARAAEQAIAVYADAVDKACAAVRAGTDVEWWTALDSPTSGKDAVAHAIWKLRVRGQFGDTGPGEELAGMEGLSRRGIVRPAWGLRVVAIATRASGQTYCEPCDKSGVDIDSEGRHKVCGRRAASDG